MDEIYVLVIYDGQHVNLLTAPSKEAAVNICKDLPMRQYTIIIVPLVELFEILNKYFH